MSTMQLALILSQDRGHLHSLSVAARTKDLGYNTRLQASLNFSLKLWSTVEVMEGDVRGGLEDPSGSLKDMLDLEETADVMPGLVGSDDDDSEDDGIEVDELGAWVKGKEISEHKEKDGET